MIDHIELAICMENGIWVHYKYSHKLWFIGKFAFKPLFIIEMDV